MLPISGQKLIDLIPQKPPFVLISALYNVTDSTCITGFLIDTDHVLCDDGKLTAAGIMENIAQTSAAKMGYECSLKGKKIPIGFIGDVRDFVFNRLPHAGEQLITEVVITHEVFDVTIVSGTVKVKDEEIASCKMKIFVEPEPANAIQDK